MSRPNWDRHLGSIACEMQMPAWTSAHREDLVSPFASSCPNGSASVAVPLLTRKAARFASGRWARRRPKIRDLR